MEHIKFGLKDVDVAATAANDDDDHDNNVIAGNEKKQQNTKILYRYSHQHNRIICKGIHNYIRMYSVDASNTHKMAKIMRTRRSVGNDMVWVACVFIEIILI